MVAVVAVLRFSTWFFGVAAVVFLALAGYFALQAEYLNPKDRFEIPVTEIDLGEIQPGKHTVTFEVTNRSRQPRRILGVNRDCRVRVCFEGKSHLPVDVQPDETFPCEFELSTHGSGPFEIEMELYVEENGLKVVPLKVRGVLVPTEEKT